MGPKVYSVSDHDIDPNLVDPDALNIVHTLRKAGFIAYIVGGSVRDLLVKKTPKDFDISTSALPEEIKDIFNRRCILIGRRFRLAHIRYGHKIFEVSTFRTGENEGSDLILQDNTWGTPEQDVLRRDFTVNGLFYDPETHSIIDYVGGWEDIHKKLLRTIGNPEIRFKQDPVRMIRLLKFRARFGFSIDQAAKKALIHHRSEILKSSPARILEEILRMLESGAAGPFFNLLSESGILELLYPALAEFLKTTDGNVIPYYLAGADKINQGLGKNPLERPVLAACLLFPIVQQEIKSQFLDRQKVPHLGEIIMATTSAIKKFEFGALPRFPRRISAIMIGLISNQYRLTPLTSKRQHHPRILRQRDFAEALKFLKIRALVDKNLIETYTNWNKLYKDHTRKHHKHHHHHPAPNHSQNENQSSVEHVS